jgi:hypothetical protein
LRASPWPAAGLGARVSARGAGKAGERAAPTPGQDPQRASASDDRVDAR